MPVAGQSLTPHVATGRRAVLLSLLLAQARNTFRPGGAHDIEHNAQTSVPEIANAWAGHRACGL